MAICILITSQSLLASEDSIRIIPQALITDIKHYTDTTCRLTIEEISEIKYSELFKQIPAEGINSKYIHWIKFRVDAEELKKSNFKYLWFPYVYMPYLYQNHRRIPLYYLNPDQSYYTELKNTTNPDDPYYLKIDNRVSQRNPLPVQLDIKILDEQGLDTIKKNQFFNHYEKNLFKSSFLYIIFFLLAFTFFQWTINKQIVYFHYSIYLFFIFLFYLLRTGYLNGFTFEWIGGSKEIFSRLFSFGILVGYMLFVTSFLSLSKKAHPGIILFMKTGITLYFIGTLLFILSHLTGLIETGMTLYFYIRDLTILIFGSILAWKIYKIRTPLSRIILSGSLILLILSLMNILNEQVIRFTGRDIEFRGASYAQYGILLELLIFSIGLGYKSKLTQNEKDAAQQNLIVQLKENQTLQTELTKKLKLEKEKLEIEQKLGQTELRLLKAQINPHFLFNSFNSLKDLIHQNKTEEATQYLTRFTKMMRGVLNSSDTHVHSLKQELEFSENYVQLEALRFAKELEVDINAAQDTLDVPVPTLILQPLLENAIWHGLLHNTGSRKLKINTRLLFNQLQIEIMDNGVGLSSKTVQNGSPSFGLRLVQDRLKIQYPESTLQIMDRFTMGDGEAGTVVKIDMPIIQAKIDN